MLRETSLKLLCLLIIASTLQLSSCAHILGIPMPFRSHSLALMQLSDHVYNYYGHTTTMILADYFLDEKFFKEKNLTYLVAEQFDKLNIPEMEKNMTASGFEGGSFWQQAVFDDLYKMCDLLLTDRELFEKLKKQKFDIALVDNFPNCACVSVLAYKLSIPYIHYGRSIDFGNLRLPVSLSSVPISPFIDYSYPLTFRDRLLNVISYHIFDLLPFSFSVNDVVGTYAPEKPHISKQEMKARSEMELLDFDVLLDATIPSLPNIIHVGGLTTKPFNPLKSPLREFMDKAINGAILISFGSLSTTIPDRIIKKLQETFQKLKDISFVIKIVDYTFKEKNVLSMAWVPQNDILGHKNTKAFLTHCGNRGQFEALYNGVPMIGLPLFADQPYNAYRMTTKGYGFPMDISKVTSEELADGIREIINNPKYKNSIQKASMVFRNRPQSPGQRAAFWIDHTIKFGGKHLRPYETYLPYYQYRLLDVYGFLFLCFCVVLYTLYFLICRIVRRLFSKAKVKHD